MPNTTCNTSPNTQPNNTSGTLPSKYSDDVLDALENVREANVSDPSLRLSEMASTPEGAARIRRTIEENYFIKSIARRVTLSPGSGNQTAQWLTRHFPSLLSRKSDAAKVRSFLEEVGTGGKKLLDTLSLTGDTDAGLMARMLIAPITESGYKKVRKAIKQGGATLSKDVIDRMWLDAVELARTPVMYQKVSEGVLTQGAYRAMSRKYDRFLKRVSSYGLGEQTVTLLLEEAENINKAFADLHAIGDLAGLDIGDVADTGISFMPRQFSDDFQFRINRLDDEVRNAFEKSPTQGFEQAFRKSRTTYDFTVEDELILASVMGLVDSDKITKLRKEIDTVTDELLRADLQDQLDELYFEATEELIPFLDQDGLLTKELANLPDEVVERLIDSGVLGKVPMTTTEVADYLISKYDLPYSGIDDLLVVDSKQAYHKAKQQLESQLEKSFTLKGMYKDAVEDGWAVTPEIARTDPQFSKFVPLDSGTLERAGVEAPTPLYFHPLVADSLHAMFDVATDPVRMGELASIWEYTWKLAKEQVLTTSGFLGRQVIQLFISSALGGTNMAHVPSSIGDWLKFSKKGLDVFDQTSKFIVGGVEYTFRDVISEAIKKGHLDTGTGAGLDVSLGGKGDALNPAKAAQAIHNWGSIATGKGAVPRKVNGRIQWDAVEYGAGLVGRMSEEAAGKVMSTGVWLEQAYKVAFIKSKLDLSLGNVVGSFVTGRIPRTYDSLDDIFEEMGDYFLNYGNRGLGDDLIAKRVAPFWMYMSRSLPAVYRHVLRNPKQFVIYNRLYALANEEVRQRGENAPGGGFAPWQQGQFGHLYFPHPLDNGDETKYVHIPFTSVDPVADSLNRTDDMAGAVLSMFGYFSGTNKDKLDAVDPTQSNNAVRDLVSSFGPGKALYGIVTKTDDRGRSLKLRDDEEWETLLGLPVLGGKYSPLTRYTIESVLPVVSNLNRWNPGEVFGVSEKRNQAGELVREGKDSVFGFSRTDSDSDVDDLRGVYNSGLMDPVNLLRGVGITVNSVDTAVGMGYTVAQLNRAAKEHKKNFTRLSKALSKGELKGKQEERAYQSMITSMALYLELETGKWEGGKWLNARDYLTRDQQKRAQDKALRKLRADQKTLNKLNALSRSLGEEPTRPDIDPSTLTEASLPTPAPTRPSTLTEQFDQESANKILEKP